MSTVCELYFGQELYLRYFRVFLNLRLFAIWLYLERITCNLFFSGLDLTLGNLEGGISGKMFLSLTSL